MVQKKTRVFLSHASEDKAKVLEVYRELEDRGFRPWLDALDLLPGQKWEVEIPKAIKRADCVLVFFSAKAVRKRGYLQKEFRLVLETVDEIPGDRIFVIPVRLDECEVPEAFLPYVWADLFEEGGLDRVCLSIETAIERPEARPRTSIPKTAPNRGARYSTDTWKSAQDRLKAEFFRACLTSADGNVTLAAKKAGVSRSQFHQVLLELGLKK